MSGEEPSEAHVPAQQPPPGPPPRVPPPHGEQGRPPDREGQAPQGPTAPVRVIGRLRHQEDFRRLRREARRYRSGPLSVAFAPDDSLDRPLVGFGIGRAVGSAVARNRLRRRLREALRHMPVEPPAGRYVFRAAPGAATLDWPATLRHATRLIATLRDREAA